MRGARIQAVLNSVSSITRSIHCTDYSAVVPSKQCRIDNEPAGAAGCDNAVTHKSHWKSTPETQLPGVLASAGTLVFMHRASTQKVPKGDALISML